MPVTQVNNTGGAFGQVSDYPAFYGHFVSDETTVTISKGMLCSIKTNGHILKATTSVTQALVLGPALANIPPAVDGPVAMKGTIMVSVPSTGTVTAGDLLTRSGSTAGSVATDTTNTTSIDIGIAITANGATIDGGTTANTVSMIVCSGSGA